MGSVLLSWISELEKRDMSAAMRRASCEAEVRVEVAEWRVEASLAPTPARVMREAVRPIISAMGRGAGWACMDLGRWWGGHGARNWSSDGCMRRCAGCSCIEVKCI